MFTIHETLSNSIDELLQDDIKFIKSNKRIEYMNCPCVLDFETSSFYTDDGEKRGCMYAFVLGINGRRIIGRTYDELIKYLNRIAEHFNLNLKRRMIIYVHNLAFDFQWLRKWLSWEKVFATDERTPLYAMTKDGIEFRCSYLLSGYSLETIGKHLTKYKAEKMVGDLDYSKIRHYKTPLTEKEIGYIDHDGIVVMCYIQEEIESHHNNITLLPLTKTGKVRTYVRRTCLYKGKHDKNKYKFIKYRNMMKAIPIQSLKEYEQLKRAFQGGFTHANSYYVNKTINDVYSMDFTSSYSYVMVSEEFPMGKGKLIDIKNKSDFEKNIKHHCCLFDVTFENIESSEIYEHPISISKCYHISNYVSDNGRLVSADKISITVTEQDFIIIKNFYSWKKMFVKNFRRYPKNYLPHDFVSAILKLYADKTTLKGIEDKYPEYMNSKEMLNSTYGMTVTDILRDTITYTDDEWGYDTVNPEEELEKYNTKPNRFLCYQWGVWVTAYARKNLFSAIYHLKDDYRYSDTDSVKFVNYQDHEWWFKKYNENVRKKLERAMYQHGFSMELCEPLTIDGKRKMIGVWDFDGYYKKFKTLGAKRYMVLTENGYSLTVSGVNKKYAIPYLLDKYHDKIFDEFTDGLVIPPNHTGKNIHTYIDDETDGEVMDYFGNVAEYHELSSIHMEPSGYELSLSKEFIDYLLGIKLMQ